LPHISCLKIIILEIIT